MVSSEKALITITYVPYPNQLRDVNPVGWFTRYAAIHVREIKSKPFHLSKTAVVNLLSLMLTSKSKYESLLSFSVVRFSSSWLSGYIILVFLS